MDSAAILEFGGMGIAVLMALIVRDMVGKILSSRVPTNGSMATKVSDLHDWHSPDSTGRQTWKGLDAEILEQLKTNADHHSQVRDALKDMAREISGLVDHMKSK